jgi:hypothetical protein
VNRIGKKRSPEGLPTETTDLYNEKGWKCSKYLGENINLYSYKKAEVIPIIRDFDSRET